MEFRPCIDIHDGKVKQIVGSTLCDRDDTGNGTGLRENFVAGYDASYYAGLYAHDGLKGGHVILLNANDSPGYASTKEAALRALATYPGGLQAGGGITDENAAEFLSAGASHVIVTSYVFSNGNICYNHLDRLVSAIGREHVVLDLSCRRLPGTTDYMIVTDRWQKFTDTKLSDRLLSDLSQWCDEFLVHAVDAEGKVNGIEEDVVRILAGSPIPVTYAGGISSVADLAKICDLSDGHVNVTVGSALSLFGGALDYREVLNCIRSWS